MILREGRTCAPSAEKRKPLGIGSQGRVLTLPDPSVNNWRDTAYTEPMMKGDDTVKRRNDEGATLIEIMVAIALLAIIVIPACSSLILSHKINAKTEKMLQAQLAVSSAVETLMAEGVPEDYDKYIVDGDYGWLEVKVGNDTKEVDDYPNVKIKVTPVSESESSDDILYYNVEVVSEDEPDVVVKTTIRKQEGSQ